MRKKFSGDEIEGGLRAVMNQDNPLTMKRLAASRVTQRCNEAAQALAADTPQPGIGR